MQNFLAYFLGAGSGLLGTIIRTILGVAGGYLIAHGVDATAVTTEEQSMAGLIMAGLAAIGSHLNNGVATGTVAAPTPPKS